jgi:hypothetical protein
VLTFTIRPRPTRDGFNLQSEALSHAAGLWYREARQAIDYALERARAHRATIEVYDEAGRLIETITHCPQRNPQTLGDI